jgi:hypothetical protein
MKCALEMKIAIVEKLAKEEAEKLAAIQAKIDDEMVKYLNYLPKINAMIEKELLKNNGVAEILLDKDCSCLEGFYFVGWKDYTYLKNRPYWDLRRSSASNLCLEHYCQLLRSLCYEVEFVPHEFLGWSSTGKTTHTVHCYKLVVKIPQ